MICKNLRQQKNWSQEQLALASGLSLRTIQRIESGRKASIESLKSIAAALDVDIETLQQDITIIDKASETWRAVPRWVRIIFWGSNKIQFKRRDACALEMMCLIISVLMLSASFIISGSDSSGLQSCSLIALASAYFMSLKIRLGDKYSVW